MNGSTTYLDRTTTERVRRQSALVFDPTSSSMHGNFATLIAQPITFDVLEQSVPTGQVVHQEFVRLRYPIEPGDAYLDEMPEGDFQLNSIGPMLKSSTLSNFARLVWIQEIGASEHSSQLIRELVDLLPTPLAVTRLEGPVEIEKLSEIQASYICQRKEQVIQFIARHPFLVTILLGAIKPLRTVFGSEPKLTLSLIADPEEEGLEELIVAIHTTLPPAEAVDRLHAFDDLWFLDHVDRCHSLLNFNIEFV